ncbi:TolB-like translocation protein [Actinomadura napierensis]|uniref:WD40 repeat domain-containing protein n=1 Tax=Actinomadura napierensis TaxID=267854 RepID=A0ABP5KRZ5_9ACTN
MRTGAMDGGRDEGKNGIRLRQAWRTALPVGVAAAAALFLGGSIDVVHRHQREANKKHDAEAAAVSSTPPGPRFVVGVARTGTALTVRDARSGATVGLPVAAPEGRRFQRVAGDGDSYVVASYGGRKVTFQRLKLDGDGRPESLTELPKATISGVSAAWSDLAVASDGDRIAYVTYRGARARVDVVSARTGARKAWTTRYSARVSSLSWAGDTLAFVWNPVRRVHGKLTETGHEIRTLDTGGAAGDLKASRAVAKLPEGTTSAVISHDGKTVVAGVVQRSVGSLQAYSAATGEPTKILWTQALKAPITGLDSGDKGKLLISAGDGRVYAVGAGTLPGKDLADTAW